VNLRPTSKQDFYGTRMGWGTVNPKRDVLRYTPPILPVPTGGFVRWEIIFRSCSAKATSMLDCDPVRLRHVHGDEFDVAVHRVENEGHVARQPVLAADQKRDSAPAAVREGPQEYNEETL
jgi:hypothetical protein